MDANDFPEEEDQPEQHDYVFWISIVAAIVVAVVFVAIWFLLSPTVSPPIQNNIIPGL